MVVDDEGERYEDEEVWTKSDPCYRGEPRSRN